MVSSMHRGGVTLSLLLPTARRWTSSVQRSSIDGWRERQWSRFSDRCAAIQPM